MKVLKVLEPGKIEIGEKPYYSEIKEHEVVIKMKCVSICGSDMHIYNGESAFAVYPNIMGHELTGEVYEVGSKVVDLKIGDKVAVNNVLSCGKCYACKIGRNNVCRDIKVLGVHVDGGCLEYLKVSEENVFKVADSVPWEFVSLTEPYAIVAQVLSRGKLCDTDTVLICGAGPLGLMLLQAVKRKGNKVLMIDIEQTRLDKAIALGADIVINTQYEDATELIMKYTDDNGISLIIEATGNIKVLEQCVSMWASQAGRVVVLGFPKKNAQVMPYDIMRRELEIIGSRLNNNQFPTAIKWIENKEVDPSVLISHTFYYEDAKQALDFIKEKPNEVCKVVLKFDK